LSDVVRSETQARSQPTRWAVRRPPNRLTPRTRPGARLTAASLHHWQATAAAPELQRLNASGQAAVADRRGGAA